jgi:hypothetical protein
MFKTMQGAYNTCVTHLSACNKFTLNKKIWCWVKFTYRTECGTMWMTRVLMSYENIGQILIITVIYQKYSIRSNKLHNH